MASKQLQQQQFRTSVYLGTVDGKKIIKTVRGKNKKDLNKKVQLIKNDFYKYQLEYRSDNFNKWSQKWLEEYKKPSGLSKGTIVEYESAIKHINNFLGDKLLSNVTLSDFQCMVNSLANYNPNTQKPMAKKTLENIVKVASAICRYASSNNVERVPRFFKEVMIPKKALQNKRRALNYKEQRMIVDTPHKCQLPAMIMMFSGIRRGELIPLLWTDIDLDNGFISITKSVDLQSNNAIIKNGGKTASAIRKVAIPPILIDYLKNCTKETELVCTNRSGKLLSKSSFRKMWDNYIYCLNAKYGYDKNIDPHLWNSLPLKIERFTPHYLRHTYATILYLQGVDVVTAKQYLGHADVQTTINIYTDLTNYSLLTIDENYKRALEESYKVKNIRDI